MCEFFNIFQRSLIREVTLTGISEYILTPPPPSLGRIELYRIQLYLPVYGRDFFITTNGT